MIAAGERVVGANPFVAYSYSYPHKSAYRPLGSPIPLEAVWANERRTALFLYVHIPFCEYRCGFCNLFTLANVEEGLPAAYLRQVRREAEGVRSALPDAKFARLAIGGGTPTYLSEGELAQLIDIVETAMGVAAGSVPTSCEASPATLTAGKARLLRQWGVDRLSLGVQTFDDREAKSLGRPQAAREVYEAIAIVRDAGFAALNLDLIYGVAGQTLLSWRNSVARAIELRPEEVYLYPLYVRELTGLGKIAATAGDNRLELYRAGREMLLDAGYEQVSLRMFRLPTVESETTPVYCCQSDGMVGLGCGARSYTRELHYSTEFAVGRSGVRSILGDYLQREPGFFRSASYGVRLDGEDQRRRLVILSLLQQEGLRHADYAGRFGTEPLADLPQLGVLVEQGLATDDGQALRLTAEGLEWSDAIGPWLYSERVRRLMEEFECR